MLAFSFQDKKIYDLWCCREQFVKFVFRMSKMTKPAVRKIEVAHAHRIVTRIKKQNTEKMNILGSIVK